jgi:hypothetical protein
MQLVRGGYGRPFFMRNPSNRTLRTLAQDEFLDLSSRGLGQRPEHYCPGRLETGEVLAAKGDDLVMK